MKNLYIIIFTFSLMVCLQSCRKYLDLKPDSSLVIPQSLTDCQLLLDDSGKMNGFYPSDGEAAADNYYFSDVDYNGIADLEAKNNYIWSPDAQHVRHWTLPYQIVYNANLVLQTLNKLPDTGDEYKRIKGSALFFRAFAFYHIAQLFTKPYNPSTSTTDLGIPQRLSPDLDTKIGRGNLQQTYDRIINDLKDAITLLPINTSIQTRPSKAAAYGALARTYLTIQDYTNAGIMADKALKLKSTLMDFKNLIRITRFNSEVIFQATTIGPSNFFTPFLVKIAPDLHASYEPNDRRKNIFFRANTGPNLGTFAFIGSYDGTSNASLFTGIATDELFLISAECKARTGNLNGAMIDLNTLLRNRYDDTFKDVVASNTNMALSRILAERRKELIFRNHRWTDIRRLNQIQGSEITLRRPMNSITYNPLVPGDLRYVMLIPLVEEISQSGIQQNVR